MKVIKKPRKDGPSKFNFEEAHLKMLEDIDPGGYASSLHEKAEQMEEIRQFDFDRLDPNERLELIKKEMAVRGKITTRQVFINGLLLCEAKEAIKQKGKSWTRWVKDDQNCAYSYSQVQNFMRVYKECFSMISIAMELPPSILYEVSEPNFPDKLRQYLFEEGGLVGIKHCKVKEMKKKYQEKGFEGIEDDIQQIGEAHRLRLQIKKTQDQYENLLRTIAQIKDSMEQSPLNEAPEDSVARRYHRRILTAVAEASSLLKETKPESIEPAA